MSPLPLRLLSLALPLVAGPALAQGGAVPVDAPWVGYPTSAYPDGLGTSAGLLADLTGDGHLDALTVSWPTNGRLSILAGDGLGGFAPAVVHDLPSGSRALAVADDQDPDQPGTTNVLMNKVHRLFELCERNAQPLLDQVLK